jgi:hypothetical protein
MEHTTQTFVHLRIGRLARVAGFLSDPVSHEFRNIDSLVLGGDSC